MLDQNNGDEYKEDQKSLIEQVTKYTDGRLLQVLSDMRAEAIMDWAQFGLTPTEESCFLSSAVCEDTYNKIAVEAGINRKAVDNAMQRATKKLRNRVAELSDEEFQELFACPRPPHLKQPATAPPAP